MADLVLATKNPGPIKIPAWDDILHIQMPVVIEPDQRKVWNNWRAEIGASGAGVPIAQQREIVARALITNPPPIPAEVIKVLQRKWEMYAQHHATAIPAWRQKVVAVLTQLDNLEDDISTALWIGGPLLRRLPGGALIEPIARGTMNALNSIERSLAGPSVIGRKAKTKAERERYRDAKRTRGKLGVLATGAQWLSKNWGHLLEAGQSADTHLGVGISLGAIYGAIEEAQDRALISAWNGAKYIGAAMAEQALGVRGYNTDDLRQMRDDAAQEMRRTGLPLARQIGDLMPAAAAAIAPGVVFALRGLAAAVPAVAAAGNWFSGMLRQARAIAGISQDNPDYTSGEHALALLAVNGSLAWPAHIYNLAAPALDIERVLELPMPVPRILNPVTRDLLSEAGCRFDAAGRPLGEWAANERSVRDTIDDGIADYLNHHDAWLPPATEAPEIQVLHTLAEYALHGAGVALTGRADGIAIEYPADVRAEMYLYHTGEYPPRDIDPKILTDWMREQTITCDIAPDDYDERTWRRITRHYWRTSQ